jgi:maltooligosyltrehalose trehalohydrolase
MQTNSPGPSLAGRTQRRWPIGAEVLGRGRTHFRVWALRRRSVAVVVEGAGTIDLTAEGNGFFSGEVAVGPGALYRYRLDDDPTLYPDPASRFQPHGPHGASEIVDPRAFAWTDDRWPGAEPPGRVLYEMHVGTFTPEGTWQSAMQQLPRLADVGVNLLEVMPVAEFPGRFGWGYDGVDLFAPFHLYGRPDDFRAFVDRAHALGLGVILDVVYNHLGPAGNYLPFFSPAYLSDRHSTEWGDALNFDGPDSDPVREFVTTNAAYWIEEFHLDGLRLDATQSIFDDSPDEHILTAIARSARQAAGQRRIVLVAENEPQHAHLARPVEQGGLGLDMLWNDDFHHSARVALTGRAEAYYSDHRGQPQELLSAIKYGFLFQGQFYSWQEKPRGTPALDLPPWAFVFFLDNHDQVANSGPSRRTQALSHPGAYRALTALLLLAPGTPLLFQGQEFASSAPFCYFADHEPKLARKVGTGRLAFLRQFPSLNRADLDRQVPAPYSAEAFQRCKLDPSEADRHPWAVALHRDLLHLRRQDPTFRVQRHRGVDGAVLGPAALVLRYFGATPETDRLLLINLGVDTTGTLPEPLLAPAAGRRWRLLWSSEEPRYGGSGTPALNLDAEWSIPGQAALVFAAEE